MSEFIKVTPEGGERVLHPEFPYTAIPEEGIRVRKSVYWSRMAKQGAVKIEEIDEREEEEKPQSPKAESEVKKAPSKKGVNDAI